MIPRSRASRLPLTRTKSEPGGRNGHPQHDLMPTSITTAHRGRIFRLPATLRSHAKSNLLNWARSLPSRRWGGCTTDTLGQLDGWSPRGLCRVWGTPWTCAANLKRLSFPNIRPRRHSLFHCHDLGVSSSSPERYADYPRQGGVRPSCHIPQWMHKTVGRDDCVGAIDSSHGHSFGWAETKSVGMSDSPNVTDIPATFLNWLVYRQGLPIQAVQECEQTAPLPSIGALLPRLHPPGQGW